MLRVAHLLQCIGAHVMICDHQSIGRNKRTAAAGIKSDAGFLQMFKPLRCRLELMFVLELFQWRRIEKPHSFISKRGCIYCKSENKNRIRQRRAKWFRHESSIKRGDKADNLCREAVSFPLRHSRCKFSAV